MSADLFTNATETLQRMESVLDVKMKKYNAVFSKDRLADGKVFYHYTITGTTRTDTLIYNSIDGESFPDLFTKVADYITTVK